MASFAFAKSGYCMKSAAACTSAHNLNILGTVILAVSILRISNICALCT